jgi:aminomethyltransferase
MSLLLKTTPFHERTAALSEGYAWRRWAGYVAASSYELSHEREYASIRNSAALFDVTPLYKYHISGRDSTALLDRVVTRDMRKCGVNHVMYTPWCDAHGKVLDDGTVARLGDTEYRMTSAEPNLRWLRMNSVGLDVKIEDVSNLIAAVSLQGPTSREILLQLGAGGIGGLKYFRLMHASLRDIPVTITRTGYTGDLGFEIWTSNAHAVALWDALMDVGSSYGIQAAGLLALDIARNEAGLILLDVDYVSAHHALIEAQKSSPFELGLGWTVARDKGPYVGQRALEAERANPSGWSLVGLDIDWESLERLYAQVHLPPRLTSAAWRASVPLYHGSRQVGYATSGTWSPLLKKNIALAHVRAPHGAIGASLEMEVTVEHHRKRAHARVVSTPFFDPERKRA